MTISSTTNRVSASGNGVTTAFSFPHPYRASTDLRVIVRTNSTLADSLKTEGVDYTVSGTADTNTGGFSSGTVNFSVAPASGTTVIINRQVPLTSSYDPTAGASDTAPNREGAIDRLTLALQGIRERIARMLILPEGTSLTDQTLPEPSSSNAGKALGINAGGTAYDVLALADLDIQTVTPYALGLLDDADAASARTTLGLNDALIIACSDEATPLTTGTAKVTFRMPYAMTLSSNGVRGNLKVAQTSGSIFTADINKNGTSILSTKLTIDNGGKTSTTAATAAVISTVTLADDDEITVDIDQIGDGTAKGLKIALIGYRT